MIYELSCSIQMKEIIFRMNPFICVIAILSIVYIVLRLLTDLNDEVGISISIPITVWIAWIGWIVTPELCSVGPSVAVGIHETRVGFEVIDNAISVGIE